MSVSIIYSLPIQTVNLVLLHLRFQREGLSSHPQEVKLILPQAVCSVNYMDAIIPITTLIEGQVRKKKIREAGIVPGNPLPNNGACKHYKKSFRWFRFPCCGRAYPCDTCHDEAVNGDHSTQLATRSICGFCCKEQNIAKPECQNCGLSTVQSAITRVSM